MDKTTAILLLGGTRKAAADAIGCSPQSVSAWPDVLPRRIEDRVLAACVRRMMQLSSTPARSRDTDPEQESLA